MFSQTLSFYSTCYHEACLWSSPLSASPKMKQTFIKYPHALRTQVPEASKKVLEMDYMAQTSKLQSHFIIPAVQ